MRKISAICLPLVALSATIESKLSNAPQITVSPTSFDFGTVDIGSQKVKTSYVTNNGDTAITMQGVGFGTPDPFHAVQSCQGKVLKPGESCEMNFVFTPTTSGTATAYSWGTWNDLSFNITMNGTTPENQSQLLIGPDSLNFEDVQVGSSIQKVVYILNAGDRPVIMEGVGGGTNAPFQIVQNCQHKYLNPGTSCQMTITFTPTTSGSATAFSYGTWNGQEFNITLNGNGYKPVDQLVIAPTTLDFGDVRVGDSKEKYAYITNVGEETVTMYGVGGGTNAPIHAVQNCQHTPLKPGNSCYMAFNYTPTTSGPATQFSYGTWNGQAFNITLSSNATTGAEQLFLS